MKNIFYVVLCVVLFMGCQPEPLPTKHVDIIHYDLNAPAFLKMVTPDEETKVHNGEAYGVKYTDNGDDTFELIFTAPFGVEDVSFDIYNGETSYVMWSEASEDFDQYILRGNKDLLKQPVEVFKFRVVYYIN